MDEHTELKQETPDLKSGEKVFQILLFCVGLVAFSLALNLWFQMAEPRESSAAALPLFVSGAWTLFALVGVLENVKLKSPISGISGFGKKISTALAYTFPIATLVMICAIVAFCVLLMMGLSFYVITPIFLYAMMCYLMRKHYLLNLLWTGLVMAFIVIVFSMLFGVVFP